MIIEWSWWWIGISYETTSWLTTRHSRSGENAPGGSWANADIMRPLCGMKTSYAEIMRKLCGYYEQFMQIMRKLCEYYVTNYADYAKNYAEIMRKLCGLCVCLLSA